MRRASVGTGGPTGARRRGVVTGTGEVVDMALRCDLLAAGVVRDAVSRLPFHGTLMRHMAKLVASELVTNAVLHSGSTADDLLTVRVRQDHRMRISVVDPGRSGGSAEIVHHELESGGLGLKVVDKLASSWGAERRPDGYEVWAELNLGPSGLPALPGGPD